MNFQSRTASAFAVALLAKPDGIFPYLGSVFATMPPAEKRRP